MIWGLLGDDDDDIFDKMFLLANDGGDLKIENSWFWQVALLMELSGELAVFGGNYKRKFFGGILKSTKKVIWDFGVGSMVLMINAILGGGIYGIGEELKD